VTSKKNFRPEIVAFNVIGTGAVAKGSHTVAATLEEAGGAALTQTISAGRHQLTADEPVSLGGNDGGPSPYQLLLASLGACTSMTLRMYADRKGWPLEAATVRLKHEKIHATDCEACETREGMLDRIEREIEIEGTLDEDQKQRLLQIADRCPVHRTLTSEVEVRTRLKE